MNKKLREYAGNEWFPAYFASQIRKILLKYLPCDV